MKSFEFLLKEYIEDKLGCFLNKKKTSIVYDGYVIVTCEYPSYKAITKNVFLELISENSTLGEFVQKFNVKSIKVFELIDDRLLYRLYLKGKAEVVCMFDGVIMDALYFKRKKNKLYARDEENNEHAVEASLKLPDDYINYTTDYFRGESLIP